MNALILVDIQNDFLPGGALAVPGGDQVIPVANRLALENELVIATQDWHPAHTPHFAQDGGVWPVHCVQDTWGAKLHPDLVVDGPVVRKGANGEDGYSGFTMRDPTTGETKPTELEGLVRERSITRLFVCGLATDYCVNATAIDARRLGFETSVLAHLCMPVNLRAGDDKRAIEQMQSAGVDVVGPTS